MKNIIILQIYKYEYSNYKDCDTVFCGSVPGKDTEGSKQLRFELFQRKALYK